MHKQAASSVRWWFLPAKARGVLPPGIRLGTAPDCIGRSDDRRQQREFVRIP